MFTLGNLIVAVVIGVVAGLIKFPLLVSLYGLAVLVPGLAVLVPGLAVCVRRLHDIGKSGWWVLIGLVPVIGGIWLLVLMCLDGEPKENQWGANPKA